jgi:hypothetical protein
MNTIKKILGIVWMLLAPVVVAFLAWQAMEKIGEAAAATKANVTLQWTIILIIFIPICAGLFIFGRYSYKGYYNQLPQNSEEITDY